MATLTIDNIDAALINIAIRLSIGQPVDDNDRRLYASNFAKLSSLYSQATVIRYSDFEVLPR